MRGQEGMDVTEKEGVAGHAGGEEGARCGPPVGSGKEEKEKSKKNRRESRDKKRRADG